MFALVGSFGAPDDRPIILLGGGLGLIATLVARALWGWSSVDIPPTLAGVIVRFGQRWAAHPGPIRLHQVPFFQHIEFFPLLQKPLDLPGAYFTKDQLRAQLKLSIYYEIAPRSVIPHLNKWIDVRGDIPRVTEAWLTTHISSWPLDDIPDRLPRFANDLQCFLNLPDQSLGRFVVKQTLFTECVLPPEIVRVRAEHKAEQVQQLISAIKAEEHLTEKVKEIEARIHELKEMAKSIDPVDARTLDLVQLHTLLDHAEGLLKLRQDRTPGS